MYLTIGPWFNHERLKKCVQSKANVDKTLHKTGIAVNGLIKTETVTETGLQKKKHENMWRRMKKGGLLRDSYGGL